MIQEIHCITFKYSHFIAAYLFVCIYSFKSRQQKHFSSDSIFFLSVHKQNNLFFALPADDAQHLRFSKYSDDGIQPAAQAATFHKLFLPSALQPGFYTIILI